MKGKLETMRVRRQGGIQLGRRLVPQAEFRALFSAWLRWAGAVPGDLPMARWLRAVGVDHVCEAIDRAATQGDLTAESVEFEIARASRRAARWGLE